MGMTFAGRVVQEPGPELDTCRRLGFPTDWAELANRFENPLGTRSGRGHVLMLRQDLDVLNAAGLLNQPNDLTVSDSTNTRTLKNLHVVSTRCITPGYPNDPAAVHLVELADRRRILRLAFNNHSFAELPAFNVRQTPGGNYVSLTAASATVPYTWQNVVDYFKARLLTVGLPAASDFTLPATPDGHPEGMDFRGWRALEAIGWVLDRLGMALKWDPFQDVYAIVQPGRTQSGLADAETAYLSARLHDIEPVNTWYGSVPFWVRVHFRKQGGPEGAYGDESFSEVVVSRTDLGLDASTSYGEELIFDDLPAFFQGNTPTNSADLLTRAQARAREFWSIRENFQGQAYRKAYTGFLAAFATGSQVRSVAWQDVAGGEHGGGPLTIVDRTPYQPDRFARWPAHAGGQGGGGGNEDGRPAGVPGRQWRPVGLADAYAGGAPRTPPTGYEDYVLKQWDPNPTFNTTEELCDIWRPSWSLTSGTGSGTAPPREIAVLADFKDGRPVYVTVGPVYAGSYSFSGVAPIVPLASTTLADVLTAPSTGLYLLTGYVLLSSTTTTGKVQAQIGSAGVATFHGGDTVTGVGVGTAPVAVPVSCLIQVTTAPAKISVAITNQGAVNNLTVSSVGGLALGRL